MEAPALADVVRRVGGTEHIGRQVFEPVGAVSELQARCSGVLRQQLVLFFQRSSCAPLRPSAAPLLLGVAGVRS
jgi:hypothetical protein